ncbi:Crp/Fnr family transcriptional regulator [bacterium SCSIO 12643]|nr:Crp/Fnr family transcriptional regulator [bacterium SCSIO 12643]
MKDALIRFLKSFELLTPDEINIIADHTNLKTFPKGTILLEEGDISKECYSVIQGCVREYYIVDGIEKTTAFFTEGQPVNSFTSGINGTAAKHYLECVEESILTVSDQQLEQEMCQRIPRLELIIRQEVERNNGLLQDQLAAYITSSPEQRFIKLLEEKPGLIGRVPQHQIASYLGVTPESLSRIKKRVFSKERSL